MMKTYHTALIMIAGLLLSGCSSFGRNGDVDTIASLRDRPQQVIADEPIEQSRDKALSAYRNIIQTSTGKSRENIKPEAMRRLADMLTDIDAYGDTDDDLSPVAVAEAVELYQEALNTYPDYENQAELLYHLARVQDQNGNPDEAHSVLTQLVEQHPESEFYAEAQFRRGEYLFVEKDYISAQQAYAEVLRLEKEINDKENGGIQQNKKRTFAEPAQYKKGWAHYKESEYPLALNEFMTILDNRIAKGVSDQSKLSRANKERVEDTLRAVSLSFVYQNGVESISEYFKNNGAKLYEDLVYKKLADYYTEKKRYTETAATYTAFLQRNPWHEQAPEFQLKTINTLRKGNYPKLELEARERYVDQFSPVSKYWTYYPIEERPEVIVLVKQQLTDLGTHYHAIAQKNKKPEDYTRSQKWYQRYIDSFPKDANTPKTHNLLAESFYQNGQLDEAIKAYEATAYNYPQHKESANAAYSALLAYQDKTKGLQQGQTFVWTEQWNSSALKFSETFPQHEKANEVLVIAAQNRFASKEYTQALNMAELLLKKEPQASIEDRKTVWRISAHSRFETGKYDQAELGYLEAIKLTPAGDPQKAELTDQLAASIYKQAEAQQRSGNTSAAVDNYLRIASVAPATATAVIAEYDAAAALIQANQWKLATPILEAFRNKHPGHELQKEVDNNLATAYLKTDQPEKAAMEFERTASVSTDPTVRKEALLNASDLYTKTGDQAKAMSALEKYVKAFPEPPEPAAEAAYKLATYYRKQGDDYSASQWYQKVVKTSELPSANSDRIRYLAAKSSMPLIQPAMDAYQQVYLLQPLKKNLKKKKKLMQSLLDQYTKAAQSNIAEVSSEATYQTGFVYNDFSKAIMDSERPPNLDADTSEEYDLLLEDQAIPFEEKAIDIHEINVGRIKDGVYDEWVKKSVNELKELLPARYNKEERDGGPVTRIH